jgi:hypothetical protein
VVDPDTVGIYHCYNRCSQRAFLCGFDPFTQQDFSHRKQWVRDRLKQLAGIMAVDVLDYAVLDNHLHCVLRNRPDLAEAWSAEEVERRWWLLCPERRDEQGEPAEISNLELQAKLVDKEQVAEHRKRLSCISWCMRLLCQPIARRANRESDVTGRFFAHRFGCERILDLAGLLACSMYVDLNLVRAGIATTPEDSEYTSACDRIRGHMLRQQQSLDQDGAGTVANDSPDAWLAPLFLDERTDAYPELNQGGEADARVDGEDPAETKSHAALRLGMGNPLGAPRVSEKGFLPLTLEEYLRLLDWTGRELRADKRGAIPAHLQPILERLKIQPERWLDTMQDYDGMFRTAVGRVESLRREALRRGRQWLQGLTSAAACFF